MKLILAALNAKYIHSNPAIYSLRAYAADRDEKLDDRIELAEYTINQNTDEILRDLYERRPRMIGFSCYIWNIVQVETLAEELKKVLPDTDIWFGGPEVSFDAGERLKRREWLSGVMRGEGEETFYELARAYTEDEGTDERAKGQKESGPEDTRQSTKARGQSGGRERMDARLARIQGITWRSARGEIRENEDRELLDFSRLPFPYRDLKCFENRIVYYETSRGCPYSCSYCLSSVDKQVRFRDPEAVLRDLDYFLANRIAQVKFVDRTFNCRKSHAAEIWRHIKEHDNGVTNFHFEISADLLDEEELALLDGMRPGLIQFEIGVQSVNPDTLKAIRRRTDWRRLETAVRRLGAGKRIHLHLDLIAGLPYEDYASFRNSFAEVYAMRPHQLQLGFLKLLGGTAMKEEAERYGITAHSGPPYEVLYTKWLTFGDIIRLKKIQDMLEVYYNSGQFSCSVRYLEHFFGNPFDLYEALSGFYDRNGLYGRNLGRQETYSQLRLFGRERLGDGDPEAAGAWDELLMYDFCRRERPKSRPEFAAAQEAWRDEMKRIYDAGERGLRSHTWLHHFYYSPEKTAERGQAVRGEAFLMFDYGNRSPIDYGAAVIRYPAGEERRLCQRND